MKQKEKLFVGATSLIALAIPAVVHIAAAQPERHFVPSGSMEPTLSFESRIRVQRDAFQNIAQVRRGDIIVHMRWDKLTRKSVESIKRAVGLPGDKVRLAGPNIWVNGRPLPHVLLRRAGKITVYQETNGTATYSVQYGANVAPAPAFSTIVPQGQLFCLGDNRDNANDSRSIGPVPFKSVVGKKVP